MPDDIGNRNLGSTDMKSYFLASPSHKDTPLIEGRDSIGEYKDPNIIFIPPTVF